MESVLIKYDGLKIRTKYTAVKNSATLPPLLEGDIQVLNLVPLRITLPSIAYIGVATLVYIIISYRYMLNPVLPVYFMKAISCL